MSDAEFSFWSKWETPVAAAIILGVPLLFAILLLLADRDPHRRRPLLLGFPAFSLMSTIALAALVIIPVNAAELQRDVTGDQTPENPSGLRLVDAVVLGAASNTVIFFPAFLLMRLRSPGVNS